MKKQKYALLVAAMSMAAFLIAWPLSRPPAARSPKIRRTILLSFRAEASQVEVQKILQKVRENIIKHTGIHNIFVGAQVSENTAFKYGISMDFDDEAALKAYRQDKQHLQMRDDYSRMVERAQIIDILDE